MNYKVLFFLLLVILIASAKKKKESKEKFYCTADEDCDFDATCTDKFNDDGDFLCKCNKGYSGNGNECAEKEGCWFATKQKALYATPEYSPTLRQSPATKFETTFVGIKIDPLRKNLKRGIYGAQMVHFRLKNGKPGNGGYFGVQWMGSPKKYDKFLFSIWDKKLRGLYAIPMHENCKRNCNDCGSKTTNGAACPMSLKRWGQRLAEGQEVVMRVSREPVESVVYDGITYTGHVWRVTVDWGKGQGEVTVGRILMADPDLKVGEESPGGWYQGSLFHEHLGCTPCGQFEFIQQRKGPYVTATALNKPLPKLQAMYAKYRTCKGAKLVECTCLDGTFSSPEFGAINFITGTNTTGTGRVTVYSRDD